MTQVIYLINQWSVCDILCETFRQDVLCSSWNIYIIWYTYISGK